MESALQHCAHPACRGHPPASKTTRPRIVADAMGIDSVMGERCLRRSEDDQRKVGDSEDETRILRCNDVPQVPDPRRRLLRVDANGKNKAAVLFRDQ